MNYNLASMPKIIGHTISGFRVHATYYVAEEENITRKLMQQKRRSSLRLSGPLLRELNEGNNILASV